MNVVVSLEHRFECTPDGTVWTQAAFAYPFWTRYLEVFDTVRVLARVREVPSAPKDYVRADGEQVRFAAMPYYLGAWQYVQRLFAIRLAAHRAVESEDAVIMRVPSLLANCLYPVLRSTKRPYGVEVVGDPWDVFAPGTVRHPFRPLIRRYLYSHLRRQCRTAGAAGYVTDRALQVRYPVGGIIDSVVAPRQGPGLDRWRQSSYAVSDVELPDRGFASEVPPLNGPPFRLITVGSLAQLYKGTDVLLHALAQNARDGIEFQLTVIGDGRFRPFLQNLAFDLGIQDRVRFLGQLPAGERVRTELDNADLFILPSRTEGLPRALIEAMARGLPCLASKVGGIPELLPWEDLVPPGNVNALSTRMSEVLLDSARRRRMAVRNLERARDFHDDVLRAKRVAFFRDLREQTLDWRGRQRVA